MKGKGSWRAGFETINNFRMYYRDWRPAGGEGHPPVLALHGSLSQSGMWVARAEGVGRFRFVCPDQRGYGLSADPGWGDAAADFAADAVGLAGALMIGRFSVMGHSFACAIALAAAALAPDRVASVILVDPTVRDRSGARQNLEAMRDRPERFDSYKEAARFWRESEEGAWPPAELRRFLRDVMVGEDERAPCRMPFGRERLIRLRAFQASAASDYKPVELAKGVRCPVLLFRGAKSRRFSAEGERRLLAALPRGTRTVLCPRSGHFPTSGDARLFERSLAGFLAKVK